ncbi:MAG: class I SAM-dependent methyltransferase [Vulcanibacillus sp.]
MIDKQTGLVRKIIELIMESPNKRITFYQFMNLALYEKKLGYYTKNKNKIGKADDFYTNSSVGPVFGKTIANNFLELLPYTTDDLEYNILEIGGGNGQFAKDVLDELKVKKSKIYVNLTYYMLETSSFHQSIQSEKLKEHSGKVVWLDNISVLSRPFKGIIFSNELFDAFPVHKVKYHSGKLYEIYVTWDEKDSKFKEVINVLSDIRLEEYFKKQNILLKEGQIAEVNLDALTMLNSINEVLEKGYVLTIDYGYLAFELYDRNRLGGTLICYYEHTANDDCYQNIGDQDITSHVNFSALIDYGMELGLENICFTYQSIFLLNNGILDYFKKLDTFDHQNTDFFNNKDLKTNRAIRQLITPGEMGETYKVLLQQKKINNSNYNFLKDIWNR